MRQGVTGCGLQAIYRQLALCSASQESPTLTVACTAFCIVMPRSRAVAKGVRHCRAIRGAPIGDQGSPRVSLGGSSPRGACGGREAEHARHARLSLPIKRPSSLRALA